MNSRKIRRKQELAQRKATKKAEKQISQALSSMPKKCDECGVPFVRGTQESLEWRIAVYDDGRVNLVCSSCVPEEVKNQE